MDVKIRRIYYSAFIIIFLILAPLIFLYSSGYRYDSQKHVLYKTGAISLTSQPNRADIYLNGEYKGKTADLISDIKPGFYSVKVEKNGYYSWQKELEVLATKTSIFKDIVLFKKDEVAKTIIADMKNFGLSHDKNRIAYQDSNNRIWIQTISGEKKEIILPQFAVIEFYDWSCQDRFLLLVTKEDDASYYVVNVNDPGNILNLTQKINQPVSKIKWDLQSDDYLYFSENNIVNRYNLVKDDLESIQESELNIIDFLPKNDTVYLLRLADNVARLSSYAWSNQHFEEINFQSAVPNIDFTKQDDYDSNLFINDRDNKKTILFDLKSQKIIEEFPLIISSDLSQNKNYLLLANAHELWLWDSKSKVKNLLTRYNSEINDAILISEYYYSTFVTEGKIKAIEFDSRNRITQDILSINAIKLFVPNKNDLYFFEKQPENSEVYSLKQVAIY